VTELRLVVLASDVGGSAGLGHERRMAALAAAVRALGLAAQERHLGPGDEVGTGPGDATLVLDSYRIRADECTEWSGPIVAVDDVERDLAVDLLVDPNPAGDPRRRRRARRVLHGVGFALLPRPSAGGVPVTGRVTSALVTAGGADVTGIGCQVAGALAASLPELDVRWATPDDRGSPPGVRAVRTTRGLLDHLREVDLVLTAGGVTLLEALSLGRPTVVWAAADNQRRGVEGAVAAGAARVAPAEADAIVRTARALIEDGDERMRLARAGPRHVDGRGAERVAEAVRELG
jgi:spore coat polysaccharide biosynthesis predicted glycosyltransferase SpsG